MDRKKTTEASTDAKAQLAARLRTVRMDRFGERGGADLARLIGLPPRTWYNYEIGVTVPAEVLLRFLEVTGAEPRWLLHGDGPAYRDSGPAGVPPVACSPAVCDPAALEGLVESVVSRLAQGDVRIRWEPDAAVGPGEPAGRAEG